MGTARHYTFVAVPSDAVFAGGIEDRERREGRVGAGVAVGREYAGKVNSRGRDVGG